MGRCSRVSCRGLDPDRLLTIASDGTARSRRRSMSLVHPAACRRPRVPMLRQPKGARTGYGVCRVGEAGRHSGLQTVPNAVARYRTHRTGDGEPGSAPAGKRASPEACPQHDSQNRDSHKMDYGTFIGIAFEAIGLQRLPGTAPCRPPGSSVAVPLSAASATQGQGPAPRARAKGPRQGLRPRPPEPRSSAIRPAVFAGPSGDQAGRSISRPS